MPTVIKRFRYLLLICTAILSGCFGLFDSGGDHIAGPYYTGWIDVHSSRYIGKRDSGDLEFEVIPAYIYAVGHNERFIVAKQHPLQGEFPHEKIDEGQTNYYLIDLKLKPGQHEKGLYGPMDADEFNNRCNALHVGEITFNLTYPENP
ncbi:DUF3997 domain-containing protein [Mucilaginibacter sp. Bleaf8]|uniref:DUF3997 domain-containing protein n=1 Tax=Mucilaginibacter sp. Bleaf8 TaxID=2834430 RepID=UPI001BD04F11|nr:DUF3997 domain-containing protein [Mucilaginibacter sp. Bleaf8]MBS7564128.1 DUF3997 domain-containing protein [Mucilaginibacter sp. Bleaf8]